MTFLKRAHSSKRHFSYTSRLNISMKSKIQFWFRQSRNHPRLNPKRNIFHCCTMAVMGHKSLELLWSCEAASCMSYCCRRTVQTLGPITTSTAVEVVMLRVEMRAVTGLLQCTTYLRHLGPSSMSERANYFEVVSHFYMVSSAHFRCSSGNEYIHLRSCFSALSWSLFCLGFRVGSLSSWS